MVSEPRRAEARSAAASTRSPARNPGTRSRPLGARCHRPVLAFREGGSLLGEDLGRDGAVEVSRQRGVLALDVQPEELDIAEDVGALALGSVLGSGWLDTVGNTPLLESLGQGADPGEGGHAHALELRGGRERLDFLAFGGKRVGIDEVDVAVDAASGDLRVLGTANRAEPVGCQPRPSQQKVQTLSLGMSSASIMSGRV